MSQKTKQKRNNFFSRKLDGAIIFSLAALILVPIYVWGLRGVHSEEEGNNIWSTDPVYISQEETKEAEEIIEKKKETYQYTRPTYGLSHPFPIVSVKDAYGRNVCAKKNDKPGENKQNKPVHIDLECCLDPDEIPNAFCFYDPGKYGKILERYEKNRVKILQKFREGRRL